jgi:two-component system phosphate regulon sensor histidine kinase PhoR
MLFFYFKAILLCLIVGSLLGILFNSLAWGVVLVLGGLLGWHYHQLNQLSQWLEQNSDSEMPEGFGVWSDIFNDIDRLQTRHAQSQAQLKAIFRRMQKSSTALKEGVVMLDAQGNLDWWNAAAKRLLGLKRSENQGDVITDLISHPRFSRYFLNRNYTDPLELPSPLNRNISLQISITEIGKNDRLLIVRDITLLHKLEVMRQDFIGNVSHEIKTPLTVIQGYLEAFLEQTAHLQGPMQKGMEEMLYQAKRMDNLVNDLLMLSRLEIDSQRENETQIDLNQLLSNIQKDAKDLAQQQNKRQEIFLDINQPATIIGSEKEIFSAFSNLAYNAVRYTPDGGKIEFRWWADKKGGHFSVIDDGIGIASQHLTRLTERFYRVDDSRSTASGGTGLGLAIVKHVLLRHDASLEIHSCPGKGSTFSCHFPERLTTDEIQSGQKEA